MHENIVSVEVARYDHSDLFGRWHAICSYDGRHRVFVITLFLFVHTLAIVKIFKGKG
jgi:hypothetical protein